MDLKERLRELRGVKTQKQCAAELKVKLENYNKWENGIAPNFETLCNLADYFQVSTDYLLGRSDCKKPENETASKDLGLSEEAIFKMQSLQLTKKIHAASDSYSSFNVWEVDILSAVLEKLPASGILSLLAAYKMYHEWASFPITSGIDVNTKRATMFELTERFRALVESVELDAPKKRLTQQDVILNELSSQLSGNAEKQDR